MGEDNELELLGKFKAKERPLKEPVKPLQPRTKPLEPLGVEGVDYVLADPDRIAWWESHTEDMDEVDMDEDDD